MKKKIAFQNNNDNNHFIQILLINDFRKIHIKK